MNEFNELFRKIEEATKMAGRKGGKHPSGWINANPSELRPPKSKLNANSPGNMTQEADEAFAKFKKLRELSRKSYTYACEECGYEQTFRYPKSQQLFCPLDQSPMQLKFNELSAKQRELTALIKGMKHFQSYAKTPEEEKNNLVRTAIGATGVAAGLTGAGFILRGTVGKAQRSDIVRDAVNRVVRAQKATKGANARADAFSARKYQDASIAAQGIRAKRVQSVKKADKETYRFNQTKVKAGEITQEEADRSRAQYRDSRKNVTSFTRLMDRLKEFDAEKRDLLSKLRDAASLTASVGTIGGLGYAGYRAHGLFNQIAKEVPKAAETFHREAPGVSRYAKAVMRKVGRAADGIKETAKSVKKGPIADGAPDFSRIPFLGKNKNMSRFHSFEDEKKNSIVMPLLAGAAIGAGAMAFPHVTRSARRVEQVMKANVKKVGSKVGNVADGLKKTQENVQHSTSIYSDLGKLYKEAKGGVYNILHPVNTFKETKAAFKAGMNGETKYKTRPRPEWALSARLRIKEFSKQPPLMSDLETQENGIPLNGRVVHDRFIKTIHNDDLDRRDAHLRNAGFAGAAAGALMRGKGGMNGTVIRAAIGGMAGGAGVLGIRAITNSRRDIYGDKPRWAKKVESAPAYAGAGAAAYLAAKRAKLFSFGVDNNKKEMNPALKAGLLGATTGAVFGAIPGLRNGSKLIPTLSSIGKTAALGGALAGGGTAIGDTILGTPKDGEGAPIAKRAAIGGAIAGAGLGGLGVLAARLNPNIASKFGLNLNKLAHGTGIGEDTGWRPAKWVQKAPLPLAIAGGAGIGAAVSAEHAGGEGQEVDTVNNIQKKPTLFSRLKEFGFDNQPRRAGTSWTDSMGDTHYTKERGTFARPVSSLFGLEGELMPNADGSKASFNQAQMMRGVYRQGKDINKWGSRAKNLGGDLGNVFAGNPRNRDASGRPQKREWEKSWFKNTVGAAAAGAGLTGLGLITSKTNYGRRNIQPHIRKANDFLRSKGWSMFAARQQGVKFFDDWAAYNGWDVRDPRGKSARVFAPGSRARIRREKEWHETKENRDKLHLVAGLAGAGIVGLGAAALTRKALGHSIIPDGVTNIFREPVLSAKEHEAKAAFHSKSAKNAAAGGGITGSGIPWQGKTPPPKRWQPSNNTNR